MNNLIYKKFDFWHNDTLFCVDVKYNNSLFGSKELSFWEYEVKSINDNLLKEPLKYRQQQKQGWILQSKEYRELSYIFSIKSYTKSKKINIYPLIKEQIIYDYFNKATIARYENRVEEFTFAIRKKYKNKIFTLKTEIKKLKVLLKKGKISNKVYQKECSPIFKKIKLIEYRIDDIIYWYKKRYFKCCKLKSKYVFNK